MTVHVDGFGDTDATADAQVATILARHDWDGWAVVGALRHHTDADGRHEATADVERHH